tara:strand:- start:558 stop:1769 length:1212 start_codon:yes stop_codon:yes gene_type:complete
MPLPEGVAAIFPFSPNWRTPPEQRREYLTDILYSRDRTPQRRALRSKPRETLTVSLTLAGREALACQQFLSRLQPYTVLVPLWPRVCRLSSLAGVGSTTLVLDRPFPVDIRVADHLVLMRPGLEAEAAMLTAISANRRTLTLDAELAAAWPAGSAVYPAWQCLVPDSVSARRPSAGVLELALQVQRRIDAQPPAAPYGEPEKEVDGLEVLLKRINWRDGLDATFDWTPQLIDNQVGPIATEILGRYSPLAMSAEVLCQSRSEIDEWLGFFDRLRGRRGQFLTSSHIDPLPLQAPTVGGYDFELRGVDLGRWAPHEDVVTHLMVRKPGGGIGIYAIDSFTTDFNADVTRITTVDAWDESYGPWEATGTWLVLQAHLSADALTLRWHSAEVAGFTLAITATERLP